MVWTVTSATSNRSVKPVIRALCGITRAGTPMFQVRPRWAQLQDLQEPIQVYPPLLEVARLVQQAVYPSLYPFARHAEASGAGDLMPKIAVLQGGNVVVAALAMSLDRPFPWAVGFFFGDLELSMNLWTVMAGISGFDDD